MQLTCCEGTKVQNSSPTTIVSSIAVLKSNDEVSPHQRTLLVSKMRWLATLIASVGIAAVDSVDIILKRISALLAASRVSRRKSRCTFEKGTRETSSSVTSRHFHCFRSIPIDVARKVLSFATADELVEFGQCSAHSLSLCREPSHWQQLCAQRIRDLIRLTCCRKLHSKPFFKIAVLIRVYYGVSRSIIGCCWAGAS